MFASADQESAAACHIRLTDALPADNVGGGREVRAFNILHESVDGDVRVVDHRDNAVDHFTEVVRRNFGRHTDCDTGRTVDEKVREPRRKHHRLHLVLVEVRSEIDRVLSDIRHHLGGNFRHSRLGVTLGGRRVVVARTEVSVAVDKRVAHREVLRESYERVVNGGVAVGVILTHNVTDRRGAFSVRAVRRESLLEKRINDSSVNRLHAVANVRQRAVDDNAHRVLDKSALHLVLHVDRHHLAGESVVVKSRCPLFRLRRVIRRLRAFRNVSVFLNIRVLRAVGVLFDAGQVLVLIHCAVSGKFFIHL